MKGGSQEDIDIELSFIFIYAFKNQIRLKEMEWMKSFDLEQKNKDVYDRP